MSKSTSIQLNDHWQHFLAERIEKGRFDSVSEAVRAGLRLLEAEEDKVDQLIEQLDRARTSGASTPLDMAKIISEARSLARRAA